MTNVKLCTNCGWKWDEEQTPIYENDSYFCPVCDNAEFTAAETDTIRAIVLKADGESFHIVEKFPNTLEALQKAVGGYIEAVRVNESIIIWCNEHGPMMGLNHNFHLCRNGWLQDSIVGDVIITGSEDGENVSLTDDEIEEIQKRFLNRDTFEIAKTLI
ncbi:DUF3846 domain-containing protein [Streptococcus pneumoniae]